MPRLLTFDQKLDFVTCSKDGLYQLELNPQAVRHHFVTVDETSTHNFTPKITRQCKQRDPSRKSALRRAKIVAEGKLWRVFFGIVKERITFDAFDNRVAKKMFTTDSQKSCFLSKRPSSFLCGCDRGIEGIKIPVR